MDGQEEGEQYNKDSYRRYFFWEADNFFFKV